MVWTGLKPETSPSRSGCATSEYLSYKINNNNAKIQLNLGFFWCKIYCYWLIIRFCTTLIPKIKIYKGNKTIRFSHWYHIFSLFYLINDSTPVCHSFYWWWWYYKKRFYSRETFGALNNETRTKSCPYEHKLGLKEIMRRNYHR